MSKYSVGDKFVIEIGEVFTGDMSVRNHVKERYAIKGFNVLMFDKNGLDKLKRLDTPAITKDDLKLSYSKGLNDAWDLAKKLYCDEGFGGADKRKMAEAFDGVFSNNILAKYTYHEALAKLEAYEREQAEINVGDVVRFKNTETEVLITSAYEFFGGVHLQTDENGRKGEVHSGICKNDIEKTGKHIDIQSILSEIRKE